MWNAATSSFHSLSSGFLVAGGAQSMLIVTLALRSSGAEALASPLPLPPLLLLSEPQAAPVRPMPATRAAAISPR